MPTGVKLSAALAGAVFLALAPVGLTAAHAQETFTVRWAEQWGEDYPAVRADKFFADEVTKRSNGRIKFQMYLHGQLGGGPGTVDGVQNGTVQMGTVSVSFLAGVSPHGPATTLPFMFKDEASAIKAVSGEAGRVIAEELASKKIKLITWYNLGWTGLCNNTRPLVKPDDAKGLNIRVLTSPIMIAEVGALGANPIPMNFTEVFSAMQNHTIDGYAAGVSAVSDQKWDQVTKYCSLTNDSWSPAPVLMSLDFFDRLPKDLQDLVTTVAKEAQAKELEIYAEFDKSVVKNLTAAGVKVNEVPAATLAEWRTRMTPIYDKAKAQYGESFMNALAGAQ